MINGLITIVITGIGLAEGGGGVLPQAQSHKPLLRAKTRCQRLEDSSLFPQSRELRELRSRAQAPAL